MMKYGTVLVCELLLLCIVVVTVRPLTLDTVIMSSQLVAINPDNTILTGIVILGSFH